MSNNANFVLIGANAIKTASQEGRNGAGTKKNSTLEVKPHYARSIEVTKRPIFVRGAVSLRALVRAVELENRFGAL